MVQVSLRTSKPLEDYEQTQVAKHGVEEEHLGYEFTVYGELISKVSMVEVGEDDTQVHLYHTCVGGGFGGGGGWEEVVVWGVGCV